MFFNKLREEFREMLAKFAVAYSKSVLSAIQIYNSTIEELKAKYKHTRWSEISPLERDAFEEKFNLSIMFGFKYSRLLPFLSTDYIGDTLEKLQDIENCKTVGPDIEETK